MLRITHISEEKNLEDTYNIRNAFQIASILKDIGTQQCERAHSERREVQFHGSWPSSHREPPQHEQQEEEDTRKGAAG